MNAPAWLDESFSVRFVQTLLHFLWQGTLIALAAAVAERLLAHRSAQAKYVLHVLALAAMAGCLPMTFGLTAASPEAGSNPAPEQRGAAPTHISASTEMGAMLKTRQGESARSGDPVPVPAEGLDEPARDPTRAPSTAATRDLAATRIAAEVDAPPRWRLSAIANYVTVAYLLCVLVLVLRLAKGIWGGQKLRAAATPVTDAQLLAAIARQAKRIGSRAVPAVAYCQRVSVPVVVGILHPVILLPAALASGLAPNQLEALIAHELAHLRRCDPVVNLLQHLVEAAIFFHPAVWYVGRRIRVHRENASDDLVLAAGWQRLHYADALVRMAELAAVLRRGEQSPRMATLAASGSSPSEFKRRVLRLLEPEPPRLRLNRAGWTILLVTGFSAVAAPLAVRSWAQSPASEAETKTASAEEERLGRQIDDFRLQDYLGKEHSLADFSDREVVVVAFLGVECPVSKLYGPRLESLAEKYKSRGVAVLGVDSNQQDTPTEMAHHARRHSVTFSLLKDPGNRVADQFRAERTPEAFVLDRDRRVRYWGRIDNQFGVGYARQEATEHYVASAIEDLLASRPVSVPQVDSVGCHIGRVSRKAPKGDVTYANTISRVIDRRCVECHREGGIAPFALTSYEAVAAWAETIREVVQDRRMPPWHANPKYGHFANDARMPDAEKDLLDQWVANGVPKGSGDDLPPREFAEGWLLGPPDLLITMPEPITIPPTGVVDYQYVSVDPGFTEGRWVRASEIHPGARSVVHHIVVFVSPPGDDPILKDRGIGFEMVGSYVPGAPPMRLDDGVARYVPAGSTFVFQIHYTPDGTPRQDQSQIGLYFADPATVRRTMQTGVAANLDFEIPPEVDDYRVEAAHQFSHDMELHSLMPHMHYRGKSFRAEVTYPNGSREILLDVPRYDFNWQNTYRFAEPKFIPEGTVLRCVAHFDNSADNLANPDPTIVVRWGEQTWNEMMIGYFEGVFLNQDLSLPAPQISPAGDGNYRVHFSYRPDRAVHRVNLAGTFNDWSTSSHALTDTDGDGVYTADVTFKPGDYRYKFVIDGNYWTHDPASRILTGFLHESFFVAGDAKDLASKRAGK
ncbi:MAG TPA: M56 family metallopeptidase [Pirellulales bacterium]|nr:M56 family metallopeptidase [Pirellulales bacterium]